jgi:hypothetical protein
MTAKASPAPASASSADGQLAKGKWKIHLFAAQISLSSEIFDALALPCVS